MNSLEVAARGQGLSLQDECSPMGRLAGLPAPTFMARKDTNVPLVCMRLRVRPRPFALRPGARRTRGKQDSNQTDSENGCPNQAIAPHRWPPCRFRNRILRREENIGRGTSNGSCWKVNMKQFRCRADTPRAHSKCIRSQSCAGPALAAIRTPARAGELFETISCFYKCGALGSVDSASRT